MNKHIIAIAIALGLASPAFAQSVEPVSYRLPATPYAVSATEPEQAYRIKRPANRSDVMKWEAAYLVLSAADLVITARCLEHDECIELNPVWGKKPSTEKLVIGKLIGGAIHFAAIDYISRRNPKMALRIAQISVAVQGGVVGFNLTSEF